MNEPHRGNIYEFEGFRLDAAHLLLTQNGREIPLAPKVVETLLVLVKRSGEIVSKEELIRAVWTDSIVEESNLSQNLYLLRKFLPESANGKPLIETLKRRGYRFNAEVSRVEDQTENSSADKNQIIQSLDFNGQSQNEIASNESPENQTLAVKPNNAFEACQLARIYFQKMSLVGLIKSRELLEQAFQLDPGYAPAYIALAEQFVKETVLGLCSPADGSVGAERAFERASELKANSAEFYAARGYADLVFDWNFTSAKRHLQKSLEINPHYAIANNYLGQLFMYQRQFEQAKFYIKRSVEIEPLGLYCRGVLQIFYFLSRDYDKAIEAGLKQLEMFPEYEISANLNCWSLEQTGRASEAVAEYEKIIRKPEGAYIVRWMGYAYATAGDREKALKTADLLAAESLENYLSAVHLAMIYAGLNETRQAIDYLEIALAQRDPWLLWIAADPRYDNLRSDSRFQNLEKTVFGEAI